MFKVPANSNLKISQTLIEDYKAQGDNLQVVFECNDGELRCSQAVFRCHKLWPIMAHNGCDCGSTVGSPAKRPRLSAIQSSKYDFAKVTIRAFLDWVHGLAIEPMNICELLELIKFLTKWKNDIGSVLMDSLRKELHFHRNFEVSTRLLVLLIANKFENFDGELDKTLFGMSKLEHVTDQLANLNLESETNKQLMKMITEEENEGDNDDIAKMILLKMNQYHISTQLAKLVLDLKKKNVFFKE